MTDTALELLEQARWLSRMSTEGQLDWHRRATECVKASRQREAQAALQGEADRALDYARSCLAEFDRSGGFSANVANAFRELDKMACSGVLPRPWREARDAG